MKEELRCIKPHAMHHHHPSLLQVISRDTAMLDVMHSFLQDAPQLIFQIFLLYRSPTLITGTDEWTSYGRQG